MRQQLQGAGNACKSCNYTAQTGEVRPNYTPVGHLEVTRRQVEPAACLRNTPENVRNDKRAGDRNGSTEAFSTGVKRQRQVGGNLAIPRMASVGSRGCLKWQTQTFFRCWNTPLFCVPLPRTSYFQSTFVFSDHLTFFDTFIILLFPSFQFEHWGSCSIREGARGGHVCVIWVATYLIP